MPKYRCPTCKVVADIDPQKKTVRISLTGARGDLSFPRPGHQCELAKGIDSIDFSKLEKVP
jgi:hypothetical protein